ncbi:hypothetical protein [Mycolicibacter hiberniae]|uniref:Uncharacterized protein n=1 Tax=Mycolicibacter hiberniae TaxID=29314 RepID=A0A7I7X4C7_9MYCO|nr:hypothetical protein [Mycolicibacter hiberniae]MCV7085279.1 hypothetical protein [Mycolicibacter hiberniae]ORV70376.1 hypothetical protein AWC09_10450 [Mycolicibacter hiberniae]BBZ23148.1 hypothetical protein MHIB_15660 [Mycolicibacter hiberniae]
MDDRKKDPSVVLPYLVGRPLPATEVYEAFGYRKSAYYKAAHEGRLITADNLIRVATHFGLNAVDLLVRYGLITFDAVADFMDGEVPVKSGKSEVPRFADLAPLPSSPPL